MVQAHQKQEEPDIPDFHPRKDGFVQSYKGTWKEQGMIAIAWLETADPHHLPRGVFLHGAYELSSTSERALGGPARGARQKDLGADLERKLREQMRSEMQAAGWQVVAHTREGQDIWQHSSRVTSSHQGQDQQEQDSVTDQGKPQEQDSVTPQRRDRVLSISGKAEGRQSADYTRIITARDVTFTCSRCGQEVTKVQFPGPTPRYCDPCAKEVEREKTRARVARLRARQKVK